MKNNSTLKLSDDMIYSLEVDTHSIWIPKKIATIKLCGSLEFSIYENTTNWVQPTSIAAITMRALKVSTGHLSVTNLMRIDRGWVSE